MGGERLSRPLRSDGALAVSFPHAETREMEHGFRFTHLVKNRSLLILFPNLARFCKTPQFSARFSASQLPRFSAGA